MRLFHRLSQSSRKATGSTPARRTVPRLEPLEDRTLLTTRLVVPLDVVPNNTTTFRSVRDAFQLNQPGLLAGDVIQIEPGSQPGPLVDGAIRNLANLTLQGNPACAPTEIPPVLFQDGVTITAARVNFTLRNLTIILADSPLTFLANGTVTDVVIHSHFGGSALHLNGTTAATVRNNHLFAFAGGTVTQGVLQVTTAAGANNQIQGNTITNLVAGNQTPVLSYSGANTILDLVNDNVLTANGTPGVLIGAGVNGLTLQNNTITGNVVGVGVNATAQNIKILGNKIQLASNLFGGAIRVEVGNAGTTSVVIANNQLEATGGPGINFVAPTGGSPQFTARVEGNDLHNCQIGVFIGFPFLFLDLGGGNQSSLGANNFRGFSAAASETAGAIVVANVSSALIIPARGNLFGVADPETVVFDSQDPGPARANVSLTNNPTGNAAFVQALYLKFLKRIGNLAAPGDAGGWVSLLNGGTPAATVASAIARSSEALTTVVDGLYQRFLGRGSDASKVGFVNELVAGITLETVIGQFLTTEEYRTRHGSAGAYVVGLYGSLLGRVPNAAEIASISQAIAGQGQLAVANAFLASAEFRGREVRRLYAELLHRTPTNQEVDLWVNSGLDVLAIQTTFASTPEFQVNG